MRVRVPPGASAPRMTNWKTVVRSLPHSLLGRSAKGERVSRNARIEKFDFESPIGDRGVLPDQLKHAWLPDGAVSVVVHINSMSLSRRAAIDVHAKPCRGALRCRPHYEMKIPGMEVVNDATAGLI